MGKYLYSNDIIEYFADFAKMVGVDDDETAFLSVHDLNVQIGIMENYYDRNVREIVRGRWIDVSHIPFADRLLPEYFDYECSNCHIGHVIMKTPFCYYCGAKMDLDGLSKYEKKE